MIFDWISRSFSTEVGSGSCELPNGSGWGYGAGLGDGKSLIRRRASWRRRTVLTVSSAAESRGSEWNQPWSSTAFSAACFWQ